MCIRYNTHVHKVQYTCALKMYNAHDQEVATINSTSMLYSNHNLMVLFNHSLAVLFKSMVTLTLRKRLHELDNTPGTGQVLQDNHPANNEYINKHTLSYRLNLSYSQGSIHWLHENVNEITLARTVTP